MNFDHLLISPLNRSIIKKINKESCEFEGADKYIVFTGVPILVTEENSMFDIDSIVNQTPLTQDKNYADKRNIKNFIRTSVLPTLSKDRSISQRYLSLANKSVDKKVLIIGAGRKVEHYKQVFNRSELVITSDVHTQFSPDIVFDVHQIPFKDNTFDLILVAQVMEHTIKPWVAARELERVGKIGSLIQVEVPFVFPFHGAPYDFFRFTFSGMRSLFRYSKIESFQATEGAFAAAAVASGQAMVDISSSRWIRYVMLVTGRLLFFWLKYLDLFSDGRKLKDITMPKGMIFSFVKDGVQRNDADCIADFKLLK